MSLIWQNLIHSFIFVSIKSKSYLSLYRPKALNPKCPFLESPNFHLSLSLSLSLSLFSTNTISNSPSRLSFIKQQQQHQHHPKFSLSQVIKRKKSLLIHIADHLSRRGRVLVCGGVDTSAS